MKTTNTMRNAFAVPAKARRNAGAMTHKRPPRPSVEGCDFCRICGGALDEGDTAAICLACEEIDAGVRAVAC